MQREMVFACAWPLDGGGGGGGGGDGERGNVAGKEKKGIRDGGWIMDNGIVVE